MRPPAKVWVAPYAVTLLAMMSLQVSNLGFSPLVPAIQKEFALSFSQVGLFAGMYGLISVFMSVPASLTIGKVGEKSALTGGLVVVALGLAWLSMAMSTSTAFGARALWLSGYRCAFIAVMTAIALSCPPPVRGRSMGVLGAIAALASVVGAPLGSVVARDFGWRKGVLVYSGAAMAGAVVFAWIYRAVRSDAGHQSKADTLSTGSPFCNWVVWAVALLSELSGVTSLTTNTFLPSAVNGVFKLSAVEAASMISTGFAWAIAVKLSFGFLMDRFRRSIVMGAVVLVLLTGSLLMLSRDLSTFRWAPRWCLLSATRPFNRVTLWRRRSCEAERSVM
ncbi:MAG TPA: MFS transporter [Bryobacteraceae bacterium]|jgi:predicted MFS family arabinose efflux permease